MYKNKRISEKEQVRLGNQMASLAAKRGISLGMLAALTGVSKSHLSLIRRGKRVPSPETARKINDLLSTPLRCPTCGSFILEE